MLNRTWRYLLLKIFVIFTINRPGWTQTIENQEKTSFYLMIEEIMESVEDEEEAISLLDELNELMTNPLNINKASADELGQIHYLNDFQIKSIINYRQEFGNLLSKNELILIPGFQADLVQKVSPFISIGNINEIKFKKSSKKNITYDHILRFKHKLEVPAGFSDKTDSIKRFTGSNHYLLSRHEIKINKNIKYGLLTEKDAGEPYFSPYNSKLPDHISGYVEFQLNKKLRKLIIGDYRSSFGQGLLRGSPFRLKTINAIILPERNYIKKSISASESGFQRGIAAETKFGRLITYYFVSQISCDAKINYISSVSDSMSYFSSINTSGLHRSINENINRNTLKQVDYGINTIYSFTNLTIGFNAISTHFNQPKEISIYDKSVVPEVYINHFSNFGFHYRMSLGKAIVFGEIGSDYSNNIALINGLTAQLYPLLTISIIQRYFSPGYISFSSGSFSKSSGTRNEKGTYIGLNFYPLPFLNLSLYADHYSFPWLRSNIPAPYHGNDYYLNALINFNSGNIVTLRYKSYNEAEKSKRETTGIDLIKRNNKRSLRISYDYSFNSSVSFETRFDLSRYSEELSNCSKGYYLGQKIILKPPEKKSGIWISFGLFDVPEWKNRIYIYENDLLYDFSVPVLYRRGSRFSFMLRSSFFDKLNFWIKYYANFYDGIIERGSGTDLIRSNKDSGIKLQLRIKI